MSSSVFDNIKDVTGVTYDDANYNRDIVDQYLLRKARAAGIRLPSSTTADEYKYHGAHVFEPRAGINEHVVYIDVASMYPFGLVALNASPETIIGTEQDLRASEYTEDDCVHGYIDTRPVKHLDAGEDYQRYTDGHYKIVFDPKRGQPEKSGEVKWSVADYDNDHSIRYEKCYFLNHDVQQGFLADTVEDLLQLKEEYRGTDLYAATKRIVNSIYGIAGFANENNCFRLFDWRIAECITLYGRKMIQWSADAVLDYISDDFPDAYVALGDTDGCGICLPSASTRDEAYRAVENAVEWLNTEGYDQFMRAEFGIPEDRHRAEIEVESYAPRVFVPADDNQPEYPHTDVGTRKRYGQWLTIEDGEEVDEVDITGLEYERSDVAPVTKDAQWVFFENVLRNGRLNAKDAVYPKLRELAEQVQSGACDVGYVARPGGVGQDLSEYGSRDRRASPLFRGAKYADRVLDGVHIGAGDKPQLVYIDAIRGDWPRTYETSTAEDGMAVDAVALSDPSRLPEGFDVDWEKTWLKTLKSPMRPLLETFGWSWSEILSGTEQQGLDAF